MPLLVGEDAWRWDEVRSRSRALFGSPHRLRIALLVSVADSDELYAARIANAAEVGRKEAVRQLGHLQAAGLLVKAGAGQPSGAGRPPELYERRDEQSWEALQALGERFRRRPRGAA
jgi:predicted ArsR family transcriptional regulator